MKISYVWSLLCCFISLIVDAQECKTWFNNAGLKFGEDCQLECSIAKTDITTFHCSLMCDKLCKSPIPIKEKLVFNISALYPGLTHSERILSAKYPKKMLTAYNLSRKAEKMCISIFPAIILDDVGDACRHFIWSSLLYNQFGMDFSRKILNAHEQSNRQSQESKAMDLANNRIGLMTAQKLIQTGKYKESKLIQVFKEKLKKEEIVVLKKETSQK